MKKSEARIVFKLIRMWTRAEIMSRHSQRPDWRDYGKIKLKYEDRIRKRLFGTSDLLKIGIDLGLLKKRSKKKKKCLQG